MSDYTPDKPKLKRCKTCGLEFPATKEYFKTHSRQRLRPHCKKCWPTVLVMNKTAKALIPSGQKRCSICKDLYPTTTEYFVPNKHLSTGIGSWCHDCERKRQADYRETLTPTQRTAIYIRRIDYLRRYTTRPEYATQRHSYYAKRSRTPQFRITMRRYRQTDTYKRCAVTREARRRARKRSLPSDFTHSDWQQCLDYFDNCCAVCGKPATFWQIIAQDHWIPLAKGGGTTRTNIIPLCHSLKDGEGSCNNSKHDLMPQEWLASKFDKRKARSIMKHIQAYFDAFTQKP